jgi:hypothetical protein
MGGGEAASEACNMEAWKECISARADFMAALSDNGSLRYLSIRLCLIWIHVSYECT